MTPELANAEPLLRVESLRKHYPFTKGILFGRTLGHVKAVDDVSFTIGAGETLGLVGEFGLWQDDDGAPHPQTGDPDRGPGAARGPADP